MLILAQVFLATEYAYLGKTTLEYIAMNITLFTNWGKGPFCIFEM